MSELLKKHSMDRLLIPASAIEPAGLKDLIALGFMPEIAGGARGFNQSGDVVTETADGRPLNDLWNEYQQALGLYNAQRDVLMRVFAFPVTKVIEDVFQGGDTVDFEEASEFGVPRSVRSTPPTYFSLGYSFKWWDIGARFTWEFLAESDAQQVDNLNNLILEADNRNQFNQVMKQLLNNVTRTASISGNNYSVFPIYNGDSTVPPRYKNTIHAANHQHFLTSGAATVDPGDLTGTGSMYAHLSHHGYSWQEGSALILMVNSAQMATIRGFKVGVGGAEYDFIQSGAIPDWAMTATDIANLQDRPAAAPPGTFNGLTVQGRYGPWLVVEDDLIPAAYMVGFASGGSLAATNLIGIREHAKSSLRGLRLVKGPDADYPIINSYYQRGFGTGVRQRGAGVVMQVTTNGSYTIPTGYTW
jgi:hypothetical protein